MSIAMDPARVESAQGKVLDVRDAFESSLATARTEVMSLFDGGGLEGQAATAFQGRFDEADTQFRGVMEQIQGIHDMLNSIKDGLSQSDLSIAQGMSG
jgi:WXG100 family type VII secretion target